MKNDEKTLYFISVKWKKGKFEVEQTNRVFIEKKAAYQSPGAGANGYELVFKHQIGKPGCTAKLVSNAVIDLEDGVDAVIGNAKKAILAKAEAIGHADVAAIRTAFAESN